MRSNFHLLTGSAKGIDKLWIIGDDFVAASYVRIASNFLRQGNSYIKDNFEISAFFHNAGAQNKSVMGRMRNALTTAFNTQTTLPKMIAVISEKDIMNQIRISKSDQDNNIDMENIYARMTKYMVNQIERTIATFKEHLPTKANRDNWPQVIWLGATYHSNYQDDNLDRKMFNQALEKEVKQHPHMNFLEFRQSWDRNDRSLCIPLSHKLSADGQKAYWAAFDRTIKYADMIHFKSPQAVEDRDTRRQHSNSRGDGDQNQNRRQQAYVRPFRRNFNNRFYWRRDMNDF